ncbi:MAG: hypothetical protein U9N59_12240 [Campylobacterota bacterium]|nr:hypothetical protein [Campylobacterota bacterium]
MLDIFFKSKTPQEILIEGLKKNNLGLINKAIDKGVDINEQINGEFPLDLAICKGSLEIPKLLVSKGADINVSPGQDLKLIYHMIAREFEFGVQFLIDNGLDVNSESKIKFGDREYYLRPIDFLVTREISNELISIMERLIIAGSDLNKNSNGIYPESGYNQVLFCSYLVYHDDGIFDFAKILIEKGADINLGEGLLNKFAECRVLESLLQNGANINQQDSCGLTPYMNSIKNNLDDITQFLEENGADTSVLPRSSQAEDEPSTQSSNNEPTIMDNAYFYQPINKEILKYPDEYWINEEELQEEYGLNEEEIEFKSIKDIEKMLLRTYATYVFFTLKPIVYLMSEFDLIDTVCYKSICLEKDSDDIDDEIIIAYIPNEKTLNKYHEIKQYIKEEAAEANVPYFMSELERLEEYIQELIDKNIEHIIMCYNQQKLD